MLQKVKERFNIITVQHRIMLNTFNRQSTRTVHDNMLCVSNFRLLMFSNFVAAIQTFLRQGELDSIISILTLLFHSQLPKVFAL